MRPTEPVTRTAPRRVRVPVMLQEWRDVVALHWEVDPADVQPLLPAGVAVDTIDGRTYVGLIGLRIRVSLPGGVPLPYVGRFPEVNVRVYSADHRGRRGIVFRSLDAGRLAPTVVARATYRLPYLWAAGAASHEDGVVGYALRRLWPDAEHPTSRFAVRVGPPIAEPSALEHFLMNRWLLHWRGYGRTLRAHAEHEPWPLHRAEVVDIDDHLVARGGLRPSQREPVSVLYAPRVTARIGPLLPV